MPLTGTDRVFIIGSSSERRDDISGSDEPHSITRGHAQTCSIVLGSTCCWVPARLPYEFLPIPQPARNVDPHFGL